MTTRTEVEKELQIFHQYFPLELVCLESCKDLRLGKNKTKQSKLQQALIYKETWIPTTWQSYFGRKIRSYFIIWNLCLKGENRSYPIDCYTVATNREGVKSSPQIEIESLCHEGHYLWLRERIAKRGEACRDGKRYLIYQVSIL